MATILITGSHGLVGAAMQRVLTGAGHRVRCLDLRAPAGAGLGDVLDGEALQEAVDGCDGILHLAAVSRVIWGEHDPGLCRATNEGGTRNVIRTALRSPTRPWLAFASSREVYGEPDSLPVGEDAPLRPVNVYGATKVVGERLLGEARAAGLGTAIVRLSNVYGSIHDHADRVVPAFARRDRRRAAPRRRSGPHLRLHAHRRHRPRLGAVIEILLAGERAPPPIHLLTGAPTTLGELAASAIDLASSASALVEVPPRSYDVARFVRRSHRAPRRSSAGGRGSPSTRASPA
jgi:UDP-glucose 4-epimerase